MIKNWLDLGLGNCFQVRIFFKVRLANRGHEGTLGGFSIFLYFFCGAFTRAGVEPGLLGWKSSILPLYHPDSLRMEESIKLFLAFIIVNTSIAYGQSFKFTIETDNNSFENWKWNICSKYLFFIVQSNYPFMKIDTWFVKNTNPTSTVNSWLIFQ